MQILQIAMVVADAWMAWKGLMVLTNNAHPVLVIYSECLFFGLCRGDIVFLNNATDETVRRTVGETIAFQIPDRDFIIVHRIIKLHQSIQTGTLQLVTKGDENGVDDRGIYNEGTPWLTQEQIIGKVVGFLPLAGHVLIILNEYPWLKYVLMARMCWVVWERKRPTNGARFVSLMFFLSTTISCYA